MASLQTRAGLSPSEKKLPYSITTSQVEAYLQKKVDVLCNRDKSLPQNVDVRVYTTEVGKYFMPFVIVLPTSVLVDRTKQKKNTNIDGFFDVHEQSSRVEEMLKPFKALFGAYTYNKEDTHAFSSNDWRRARGVTRTTSNVLRTMTLPRVSSFRGDGGNKTNVVTFLLDPIRVFHDMLTMQDDSRDFSVDIGRWQKIKTGEYKYFVDRSVRHGKNNRKYNDTFANELNRKMRGQR